jgi:hypothetical protein
MRAKRVESQAAIHAAATQGELPLALWSGSVHCRHPFGTGAVMRSGIITARLTSS